MVVTCPNCRARYAVDPQKIGFAGRTVQCARCSHRWFEKVERPSAPAPAATVDSPATSGSMAAAATAAVSEAAATSDSAPVPTPAPDPVPEMVIRPITPGAALPAVIPPTASLWRRAAIAAGVALLLLGGVVFAFRDEIGALIPAEGPVPAPTAAATAPAAPAPATPAKPPAAQPRPQLEIDLAKSKIDVVEGRYVVRGEVVNNGTTAGSTSQLRVTFKRNDDVLGEKTFPLVEGPLKPGDRAPFSQVLEDPPAGTTDIVPVIE